MVQCGLVAVITGLQDNQGYGEIEYCCFNGLVSITFHHS